MLERSGGQVVPLSEEQLEAAWRSLAREEGIFLRARQRRRHCSRSRRLGLRGRCGSSASSRATASGRPDAVGSTDPGPTAPATTANHRPRLSTVRAPPSNSGTSSSSRPATSPRRPRHTSACVRFELPRPRRTAGASSSPTASRRLAGSAPAPRVIALGLVAAAIVGEAGAHGGRAARARGRAGRTRRQPRRGPRRGRLPDVGDAHRADRGHRHLATPVAVIPAGRGADSRHRGPRCRDTVPHADAAFSAGQGGAPQAPRSRARFRRALRGGASHDRLHEPYRAECSATRPGDPRAATRGRTRRDLCPAPARR